MLSREEHDRAEPERRLRVLVADDVEDNRLLIRLLLRKHAVELTMASDGVEAVAAVRSGIDFDLILMDVEMPRMDGLEATREIRTMEQRSGGSRTRILAVTAHTSPDATKAILEAGCDAHMTKPILKAELLAALEALDPGVGRLSP